jgi:hypothetical protein
MLPAFYWKLTKFFFITQEVCKIRKHKCIRNSFPAKVSTVQVYRLQSSYPGGLASYIQNAKKLLADSKAGQNPYDGFTPSVSVYHAPFFITLFSLSSDSLSSVVCDLDCKFQILGCFFFSYSELLCTDMPPPVLSQRNAWC